MYHVTDIIGPLSREQIFAFREREINRFHNRAYLRINVFDEPDVAELYEKHRRTHWAHVSVKRAPQIAFTPTEFDGVKDRQVSLKLGRYLTRFMPELGEARILELVQQHNAQFDVRATHIAKTPRTISTVYQRGVNSCMAHSQHHYVPDYNPTAVYGAGDVGVFFMWDKSNKRRRITGRVLIHLERKAYGRIYGDDQRMEVALAKAGYHPDSGTEFQDARILSDMSFGDEYVCPYFDNGYQLARCSETDQLFMHSGTSAKYKVGCVWDADQTNGLAEDDNHTECYACGERVHYEDTYYASDDPYCQSCHDENYTYCENCDESVINENITNVQVSHVRQNSDGQIVSSTIDANWCEWCASQNATYCHDCEERHADDLTVISDHDDEYRCPTCHEDHEETIQDQQQQSEEETDETTIEQYACV